MRSHIKRVKSSSAQTGDYAVSLEFVDETKWCPTMSCNDDETACELPDGVAVECHGDYCSVHLPLGDFSEQDLSNARFNGSDLSCANFQNAKLQNADFSNTELCQASFVNADLRSAIFLAADLSFADFSNCDLRAANLKEVKLRDVQFKGARFDRATELPISRDDAELRGMIYCY